MARLTEAQLIWRRCACLISREKMTGRVLEIPVCELHFDEMSLSRFQYHNRIASIQEISNKTRKSKKTNDELHTMSESGVAIQTYSVSNLVGTARIFGLRYTSIGRKFDKSGHNGSYEHKPHC